MTLDHGAVGGLRPFEVLDLLQHPAEVVVGGEHRRIRTGRPPISIPSRLQVTLGAQRVAEAELRARVSGLQLEPAAIGMLRLPPCTSSLEDHREPQLTREAAGTELHRPAVGTLGRLELAEGEMHLAQVMVGGGVVGREPGRLLHQLEGGVRIPGSECGCARGPEDVRPGWQLRAYRLESSPCPREVPPLDEPFDPRQLGVRIGTLGIGALGIGAPSPHRSSTPAAARRDHRDAVAARD